MVTSRARASHAASCAVLRQRRDDERAQRRDLPALVRRRELRRTPGDALDGDQHLGRADADAEPLLHVLRGRAEAEPLIQPEIEHEP